MAPRGKSKRVVVQNARLKDSALKTIPGLVSKSNNHSAAEYKSPLQSDVYMENNRRTATDTKNLLEKINNADSGGSSNDFDGPSTEEINIQSQSNLICTDNQRSKWVSTDNKLSKFVSIDIQPSIKRQNNNCNSKNTESKKIYQSQLKLVKFLRNPKKIMMAIFMPRKKIKK